MHPFFPFFLFAYVCVFVCMYVYSCFFYDWPPSMHSLYNCSLAKVNKCMCVLVGGYQTHTFKGAKLHLLLNRRLKRSHEENQKREKSPKSTQVKNKKGKKTYVYWLVFSAPFVLSLCLHSRHHEHLCKQWVLCMS